MKLESRTQELMADYPIPEVFKVIHATMNDHAYRDDKIWDVIVERHIREIESAINMIEMLYEEKLYNHRSRLALELVNSLPDVKQFDLICRYLWHGQ